MRRSDLLCISACVLCAACGGGSSGDEPDASTDDSSIFDSTVDSGIDAHDADADAVVDTGPPVAPYDWVGVIGTGQSLSVGAAAGATVSTSQPFHNVRLVDTGPDPKYPLTGGGKYSLVPLIEPIRAGSPGSGPGYSDGQYPNNIAGETPHSGMANELTALFSMHGGATEYVSIQTAVGWSGHKIECIDKRGGPAGLCGGSPTTAYPGSIAEVKAMKQLADAAKKSFGVGAIVLTHGESDATNPTYGASVLQMIRDYQTDLKAITGQKSDVVLLASQQSTFIGGKDGSAVQIFRAGVDHPDAIICTGPKYQLAYAADLVHLPAASYVALGEKYAEVFDAVVNRKMAWQPLQPTSVVASGTTVTIDFHVPNPPLVWEETLAPPHQTAHLEWKNGRGFEVSDAAGAPLTISSAAISGSSVVLTMAKPVSAGVLVAYAVTQDAGSYAGGLPSGQRGQLRDSDPLVGFDAETLDVTATSGSNVVTAATAGAFARRAGRDRVEGTGFAAGTVVLSKDSDDQLTLSSPFSGTTGKASVKVHHDLLNYAVHFAMTAK